jgi:hypothetical protein
MCQWDVTHGRRRYAKVTSANAGVDLIIAPNKFRVAIMFGAAWLAANEIMTVGTDSPDAPGIAITTLNNNRPDITFDIETYGSLVMGGFVVNKNGVGVCTVVEILVQAFDDEQLQF